MLSIHCPDTPPLDLGVNLTPVEEQMLRDFEQAETKLTIASGFKKRPRYVEFADDPQIGGIVRWHPEMTDEERDVLLHRIRPIILHEEPFSFNKVLSVLGRQLAHPAIRLVLKEERARFEARKWQKELQVTSGNKILNSDDMFRKWLNAFEYHRDTDKRQELQEILDHSLPGLFNWVHLKILFEKLQAIRNLSVLVRVVLGLQSSIRFNSCVLEHALKTGS